MRRPGRRAFITLLGGAAAWPLAAPPLAATLRAACAQQPKPGIGFLHSGFADGFTQQGAAFRQGMQDKGYVEGQNVSIEYRWANGRVEDLPRLAMDLVKRQPAVIVTSGSAVALAAKAATTTIPIIFNVTDAVGIGLVDGLARPGLNATGVEFKAGDLGPKRLGLLRELVPTARSIAFLVNPNNPSAGVQTAQMAEAAQTLGMRLQSFPAAAQDELDSAFARIAQHRADILVVSADPFFNNLRHHVVALAARHALPAVYEWREFVEVGGLMSYGAGLKEAFRQMGQYAGQILQGAKPSDLPVIQPTRFEFVINLKAAKVLGLVVPTSMQLLADEVIE
jgi:putative ABC transport system substrate-binding protein